ncbi:MAG: SLBB domain-containing protein [Dehalococcoidia bacterium]|nr:SLBB domain-containing protein [Dehalococcoidia bacterium]
MTAQNDAPFAAILAEAQRRWNDLTAGDRPWIRVGTGLAGEAAGGFEVVGAVNAALAEQQVAANVSEVGTLGLCFAEPLLDVQMPNGPRVFYQRVTPQIAETIISQHVAGGTPIARYAIGYLGDGNSALDGIPNLSEHPMMALQQRIALRNAGNIDPSDLYQYIANGGYSALNKALTEMTPQDTLGEVRTSGLRGRGGAAFPAGVKWGFLAGNPDPNKYILCNCEEGDPGAFNDRGILESDPATVVEGITIAGYACNANRGYVFIRHGHNQPIDRTRAVIEQAYELGLLGQNILGTDFSFDVEVALTGDSYVSGEETALMEAIEGKRSMPRFRPPFPAQVGVFGMPSNINNVKTLAYVPEIIANGGAWFAGIGTQPDPDNRINGSSGTAILCLSGDITYPGLIEVPLGMTFRQVLFDMAGGVPNGKSMKLLQTGGPLGGVLSASDANLDLVLDFDVFRAAGAILGSGGIIVADEDTCVVDLTRNLIAFCQYESCGKCFPCRMGMSHLLEVLERIHNLEGTDEDLALMRNIGENMQAGSLCGHGQLGFNPVSSALRYFPEEFEAHILEKRHTGECPDRVFSPRLTRR